MTENDIYIIAKAWIEKDHESNAVDYIKLMAADLYRRIDFHTQQKAEAQQPSQSVSVEEAARNLAFKIIDGSETIDKTTKRIIEFHSQFSQPTKSDKLLSEARNIIHALSIMGKNQGWNNPASGKQTLIEEMDLFLTKTANHK